MNIMLTYIQIHPFLAVIWAATAGLLVWTVIQNARPWRKFLMEVGLELNKCSWPWNPQEKGMKRYKELIDSTVVVAVSSLILAGIVTSSDFVLLRVVGFLTRFHI